MAETLSSHSLVSAEAVLVASADAAGRVFDEARRDRPRDELAAVIGVGGDGTPTSRLDQLVDEAVLAVTEQAGLNVLSEEAGWVDRGSAVTLAVDPVDGTANALAGVPLCTFSAALVVDSRPVVALTRWLDTGRDWLVRAGEAGPPWRTTGRCELTGAAISLLRPQVANRPAWYRIAERAARVRILSCSTLEAILVCTGATDAFIDAGGDVHRYVDLVAAQLYAEAAGAVVEDVHGRPIAFDTDLTRRWSGIVAATPQLVGELRKVVTAALGPDGLFA
jgi:myo-inositol-1(or 4)-monophosphatase